MKSLCAFMAVVLVVACGVVAVAQVENVALQPPTAPKLISTYSFVLPTSNRNIEVFQREELETKPAKITFFTKPLWLFHELESPLGGGIPTFILAREEITFRDEVFHRVTLEARIIDDKFLRYANDSIREKVNPGGLDISNVQKTNLIKTYSESAFTRNKSQFDSAHYAKVLNDDEVIRGAYAKRTTVDVLKWPIRSCTITARHPFGTIETSVRAGSGVDSLNTVRFSFDFETEKECNEFIALLKADAVDFDFEYTYFGQGYEVEYGEIIKGRVRLRESMASIMESDETTPELRSLYQSQLEGKIGITQDQRSLVERSILTEVIRISLVDKDSNVRVATDNIKALGLVRDFFEPVAFEYKEEDAHHRTLLDTIITPRVVSRVIKAAEISKEWQTFIDNFDRKITSDIAADGKGIKLNDVLKFAMLAVAAYYSGGAAVGTEGATAAAGAEGVATASGGFDPSALLTAVRGAAGDGKPRPLTKEETRKIVEHTEIKKLLKSHGLSDYKYDEDSDAIVPMKLEVYRVNGNIDDKGVKLEDVVVSRHGGFLTIVDQDISPRFKLKDLHRDIEALTKELKRPEDETLKVILAEVKKEYDAKIKKYNDERSEAARRNRVKNSIVSALSNKQSGHKNVKVMKGSIDYHRYLLMGRDGIKTGSVSTNESSNTLTVTVSLIGQTNWEHHWRTLGVWSKNNHIDVLKNASVTLKFTHDKGTTSYNSLTYTNVTGGSSECVSMIKDWFENKVLPEVKNALK